jgi:hypothetical protein
VHTLKKLQIGYSLTAKLNARYVQPASLICSPDTLLHTQLTIRDELFVVRRFDAAYINSATDTSCPADAARSRVL